MGTASTGQKKKQHTRTAKRTHGWVIRAIRCLSILVVMQGRDVCVRAQSKLNWLVTHINHTP